MDAIVLCYWWCVAACLRPVLLTKNCPMPDVGERGPGSSQAGRAGNGTRSEASFYVSCCGEKMLLIVLLVNKMGLTGEIHIYLISDNDFIKQ